MALDMTSFDAALKVHYGPQRLAEIAFKKRPLLALMPKYTKFGGRNYPMPLKYAATQNRAADFQAAQRSSGVSGIATGSQQLVEFLLTRKKNYALGFLDGETIKASEGDKNAFIRAVTSEMDSVLEGLLDDLHYDLYSSDSGLRAVATAGSTTSFTVAPAEAVRFEVGMAVVHAASETGLLLNAGEAVEITDVNRRTGVITTTTASTSFAPATGEYIFAAGDRPSVALTSSNRLKMCGLDSWIPATDPSDVFKGVDRSSDPLKLGGVRVDGTSLTLSEALIEGVIETDRYGGAIDHYFMNHTDVKNLINELGSKVEYDVVKDPSGIVGFRSLKIYTPMGTVDVIGDHQCPVGVAYGLDMSTWKLVSAGPVPHLLSLDGNRMLREASADAYEFRFGCYAEVGCNAPGRNSRVALPTAA